MPGLHIDKKGGGGTAFYNNPKNYIVSNFSDIKQLMADGKLEPDRKYLLTDYLHKYFIAGSNSDGKVQYYKTYDYIYAYATFGYYVYDLPVGKECIITEFPEGYTGSLKVGDKTKVSANSQNWYFQFANGMHTIRGVEFKIFNQRFTTIEEGIDYLDANGKPVMIPGGLLNTQVHDGTAYMDMTAAENLAVVPEQLIFTAETAHAFKKEVESATFVGDIVEYNFNSTEIYNDNSEVIATRNGFITKRKNDSLAIDLPIDWRNTKFRRWQLNLDSRTKLLNQHLDVSTTKLGFQEKWLYTAGKRKVTEPQYFYVGMSVEGSLPNLNANAQKTTFKYEVESTVAAKDYPVFPIDENRSPIKTKVAGVKAKSFSNTVFQCLPGESNSVTGASANIIAGCTFVGQASLYDDEGSIFDTVSVDAVRVSGSNIDLEKCVFLSWTQIQLSNQSSFKGVVFGTMQNGVRLTGVDQPLPVVWWLYVYANNSILNNCAISGVTPHLYLDNTKLVETSVFGYYSPTHPNVAMDSEYMREVFKFQGGVFSKVTLRFLNVVDRVVLPNLFFKDHNSNRANGLFMYDITDPSYSRIFKKNNTTDGLYVESLDSDYNMTFIEVGTQEPNSIDLAIAIAVENAAPEIASDVVFTITVSNNYTNAATNVNANALLPAGYTFVSDDAAGKYDPATGVWSVEGLAVDAVKSLNITATVEAEGPYAVEASVSSSEKEVNPADNTDTVTPVPTEPAV